MGNAYCNNCCRQKMEVGNLPSQLQAEDDFPPMQIAKPVKQMVQLSAKVKDIFLRCRTPHIPQRKGTKLHFHYLFHYAAYYDGDWKNGRPHGHGRLIYDDGSLYEGCFNMGEAQCKIALFVRSDGSCYKGEVKQNKANGYGQMINERNYEKILYKGHWKDDLPDGQGKQIFGAGKSRYDGQFVKGKKHGKGIYYWNHKEYYSGSFQNNKMEGYGQYHAREYLYKGNFANGKKHGTGILQNHEKKFRYEGSFQNGKMHGHGTFVWEDGTKFVGQFEENRRTQNGVLIMNNGKVINNPRLSVSKSNISQGNVQNNSKKISLEPQQEELSVH